MNAAVFLDRDNTLIHNDGDLGDPEAVRLIQGAAASIASLKGLGYKVVVVTNQGGVARGKYTEDDVLAVHDKICQLVDEAANGARIDAFYFCPYHPQGRLKKYKKDHPNRKPQPGMLLEAAADLGVDLSQSWMVGDQMRDIQAGAAAGVRTVLVRPDADQLSPLDLDKLEGVTHEPQGDKDDTSSKRVKPGFMARNMIEAVRIIAQQRKPEGLESAGKSVRRWDAAAVAKLQRPRGEVGEATGPPPAAKRPFRPWNAPTPKEDEESDGQEAAATPEDAGATPVAGPVKPTEPITDSNTQEGAMILPTPTPAPIKNDVQVPLAELEESASDDPTAPPTAPPSSRQSDRTLRLILQELRSQRQAGDDLASTKLIALILEAIAAVCILGGLFMGASDIELFAKWIGVGVMIQLAVIALLLWKR